MATPRHLRPFLLHTEPVEPVSMGGVDLYLPTGSGPWPAVVLAPGTTPADQPPARCWPVFRGYAVELARRGVVAALPELPLHDLEALAGSSTELRRAVATVRADARVDADRLGMWFFSDAGLLMGEWLDNRPRWLRAVAGSYPRLRPDRANDLVAPSAVEAIGRVADLPVLVTRVAQEQPSVAASVAEFLTAAAGCAVEVVEVPAARDFDMDRGAPQPVTAIETALDWMVSRLTAEPAVPYQRLAAYAVLRRADEILLTRISARGHHAGSWTLPGGGVEHGEQVRAALAREVREETGLEVRIGALRDVHSVHFTGRAPSGRLEDFHGVHLIFDAEVDQPASADQQPRVMEADGSTDAVAWIGRGVIDRGDVRVLDVVRHAIDGLR